MKLYNSLTRSKEDFAPIKPGQVSMYSCGPTVYDHAHIGNLRSFITADLLYRALSSLEDYKVRWVMNFTDIDDKIIARLSRDYPGQDPEAARQQLRAKYEQIFRDDISKVGIDPSHIEFMAATDNITRMQELIRHLIDENIAYVQDGSVYFSLERYQKSGHKYGILQNVDFAAEARPTDDQDQKEGAADFALWKAQKEGEPSWDFELNGQNLCGRPGWHIECTAMSTKALGPEFDIHTGGVDLKFPHHENEIAQNEGKLARWFVHNEFLNLSGAKMSKSSGEFYTLEQVTDPIAFRALVLQSHYRKQMDFSDEALNSAHERLINLRFYTDQMVLKKPGTLAENDSTGASKKFKTEFKAAIEDDLNTSAALAAFSFIEGKSYSIETLDAIREADKILGLNLVNDGPAPVEVYDLIAKYEQTRANKDFTTSDKIRANIKQHGFVVSDADSGTYIARAN